MSTKAPLDSCGCCAGIGVETPLAVYNRPGLAAIAYRAGNYASFRDSLLARLSDGHWPILSQLRTRDSDDFTIALLDAWAVAADVLTFYQERIANEAYLRTATERLSILEQSRLLGYQLAPGLAASTYLAFNMESAPGAPEQAAAPVTVAAGTQVQSVPAADEEPQTFETIEAVEARPEWNALQARLTESQTLAWDMQELWLEGASLTLDSGACLLIIAPSGAGFAASLRRVTRLTPDAKANRTAVTLAAISAEPAAVTAEEPGVFVMRATTSPFGHNAPKKPIYDPPGFFTGNFDEWPLEDESSDTITLSARYEKILAGSWLVIEQDNAAGTARLWVFSKVNSVKHLSLARYGIAGNGTRLGLNTPWQKHDNATLALLRGMTIAAQSDELAAAELPLSEPVYGSTLALDTRVEGLAAGRPIAISGKRPRARITERAGKPMLDLDEGGNVALHPGDILWFAALPAKTVGKKARLRLIDRDGKTGSVDLGVNAFELVAAAETDPTIREIAFIDDDPATAITHDRDRTTLKLARPLVHAYDRTTVRINANVAAATHGESVKELLGSGDATLPYQSFVLRQPPLTYVSAETPSGSASTLKVYVNDVLWREAPFLYGRSANEHVYVTQRDDEGRTTIRFGDGVTGARLPTGQNNVRAEYRKGSGLGGLVKAGQLSQLLSRPLGLKEVVNPAKAEGAEAPESRDDARSNAPTTVLTLGRAVSLQDYQDFSRTFAGVAKAQAVWIWNGRKRSIFLTVAGANGAALDEDGAVIAKLKGALRAFGDPFVAFTIKSYRQALFQIHAAVTIHPDHIIATVMAAAAADLRRRYSFQAREFGQPAALSEVIAAIQSIPGVVAVDIDKFYRNDAPAPALQPRLVADRPAMGADGIVPAAELLLLDETSLGQLKGVQ